MCVLRWWATLYILFAIAMVMTVLLKKRRYCVDVCPVAFFQGITYSKKSKTHPFPKHLISRWQWIIGGIFWGILVGLTLYYQWQGQTGLLWHRLLILMWTSIGTAILLQEIYGKRIWCKYFCPLGHILDGIIKKVRATV